MKTFIAVVFALSVPAACCAQQVGRLDLTYDRFKDETTVTSAIEPPRVTNNPHVLDMLFGAYFTYPGREVKSAPDKVTLAFTVTSQEGQFTADRNPSLIILANQKRIFAGHAERARSKVLSNGLVIETLAAGVPLSIVKEIDSAEIIEMQLGEIEFQLTTANRDSVKEFLTKTKLTN